MAMANTIAWGLAPKEWAMEIPTGASIPAQAMLFMNWVAMEAPMHRTAVIRYRFLDSPIRLMIKFPNTFPSPEWFIVAIIRLIPAQNRIIFTSKALRASLGVTMVERTARAIMPYPMKLGSTEMIFRDFNTRASKNTLKAAPTTFCLFRWFPVTSRTASPPSPKSS